MLRLRPVREKLPHPHPPDRDGVPRQACDRRSRSLRRLKRARRGRESREKDPYGKAKGRMMNEKNWKTQRRQILLSFSFQVLSLSSLRPRNSRRRSSGHRVGIGHFESALLQIIAVVEFRTLTKRALLGSITMFTPLEEQGCHAERGHRPGPSCIGGRSSRRDDRHAERAIWTALLVRSDVRRLDAASVTRQSFSFPIL